MGAVSMAKILENSTVFHNGKLRFFWVENTISCGSFSLPCGYIVGVEIAKKVPPPVVWAVVRSGDMFSAAAGIFSRENYFSDNFFRISSSHALSGSA
jgi:hypothetical protein